MLNCKSAVKLISQSMDSKLRLIDKVELKLHLLACKGCTNYKNQINFLRKSCENHLQ